MPGPSSAGGIVVATNAKHGPLGISRCEAGDAWRPTAESGESRVPSCRGCGYGGGFGGGGGVVMVKVVMKTVMV